MADRRALSEIETVLATKFKNATWVNGTFVTDVNEYLLSLGNSSNGNMLQVATEKACYLLDANPECFTANWELMWMQFRTWMYIQAPILGISVLFQWLEMWRNPYVEKVRKVISYATRASAGLQLIASLFSCSAWIVRAGALRLNPATWAIESLLLAFCAVSYSCRWIASRNKVYHCLQVNNLFDLLSIVSHFSLVTSVAVGKLRYSWLNFAFLRSYIIYNVLAGVFDRYKDNYSIQLLRILVKTGCLIFFAAAVLYSLEYLGEIPNTDSFLIHIFMCPTPAGDLIPSNNTNGYESGLCTERMSLFTSFYFMLVTVSTVGYGDITPKTVLGRFLIIFFIPAGIYIFAQETAHLVSIFEDRRMGKRAYSLKRNTQHIVLTGNPAAVQVLDFLREFFHPDHDISNASHIPKVNQSSSTRRQRHAAALKKHMHLVLLVEYHDEKAETEFQHAVMDYIDENPRFQGKITILSGSPLKERDLHRAKVRDAMAVFFIPNKYAKNANEEDAANVLRVLSVSNVKGDHTQLYAMLLNAENRILLEATGIPSDHLVCSDEIKLGLMGLSCRCRGLSTLVANLIASFDMETFKEEAAKETVPLWVEEYVTGASKEIYATHVDERFHRMTFLDAAHSIHIETKGQVLLIGVEDGQTVHCNPGHSYILSPSSKVYMIAESMKAVEPFAAVENLFHNTKMTALLKVRAKLIERAHRARHTVEKRIPKSVREYISRMGNLDKPSPPPFEVLQSGGHIIICCGPSSEHSIARLVNFLRPLRKDHVSAPVPVVIVHPAEFKDSAWAQLSVFGDVYHLQGTPQKLSTLIRAGIYKASAIVVLDQGSEEGNLTDSQAIFNTILIDGAIKDTPPACEPFSIIELKEEHFNKYLDLFRSRQDIPSNPPMLHSIRVSNNSATPMLSDVSPRFDPLVSGTALPPSSRSQQSRTSRVSRTAQGNRAYKLQKSGSSDLTQWVTDKIVSTIEVVGELKRALFKDDRTRGSQNDVHGENSAYALMERFNVDDETFFQERYISGSLFPVYVADELLIQSFYNPSINLFMQNILDGKSIFMLYDIPKEWRNLQLTYGDLVDRMTRRRSHALPIGLFRAPSFLNGASKPYVYTCPYSHTLVDPQDKIFVLINQSALHRIAKKLQRRFAARKLWRKTIELAQAQAKLPEQIGLPPRSPPRPISL